MEMKVRWESSLEKIPFNDVAPLGNCIMLFSLSGYSVCVFGSRMFLFFFFFFFTYLGMQDLSSPTRDPAHPPCSGSAESSPLGHQCVC